LNPNTGTCPVFRSRRDAEITLGIYRRVPVLVKEGDPKGNPWGVSFRQGLFNMTSDSHLFHTREQLEEDGWSLEGNVFVRGDKRMLPLYEAKMLHHYDHRWATYNEDGSTRDFTLEEKQDPDAVVLPRYWVSEGSTATGEFDKNGDPIMEPGVQTKLDSVGWDRDWLLGWRDICRSTDERSLISGFLPKSAIGHTLPVVILANAGAVDSVCVSAVFSSFALDYISRIKNGGTHLTFFIFQQLPVFFPKVLSKYGEFISFRSLELIYTAYDMEPLVSDVGTDGEPFRWDEDRRTVIRAELDALFFHLYGINRDDVDYIMETFPIVKRKDVEEYGTYRTKELILEIYDRMAEAGVSQDTPLV